MEREHILNRECWCGPEIHIESNNGKSQEDTHANVIHNQMTGSDEMSEE